MCRIANGLRTDPNFAVTACNNAENVPEMTLRIKSNYFDDNLSWQTGFTLTDDETAYERKIPEDQLLIDLSDQCKFYFFTPTGPSGSELPKYSKMPITAEMNAIAEK